MSAKRDGGRWVVGARIASQACQFALVAIAAHYLTPAQFGVYALFSATSLALLIVARTGWYECVVSASSPQEKAQVNLLCLLIGGLACLVALLAAVSYLFMTNDMAVGRLAILLAAGVLPACLTAPQSGVLVAEGRVGRSAQIELAGELLAFVIGVLAFELGFGIVSLAVGRLFRHFLVVVLAALTTRWFPVPRLQGDLARPILDKWKNYTTSHIMGFAANNASIFVIGGIAGPAEAGIFRAGMRFAGAVNELITESIRFFYWSGLSAARDQGGLARVRSEALRLLGLTFATGAPLLIGLAATSEAVVLTLLGEGWREAAPVTALQCIAILLFLPRHLSNPLLTLTGAHSTLPKLVLVATITNLVAVAVGSVWGAIGVAASQVVSSALYLPYFMKVLRARTGFPPGGLVTSTWAPMLASLAMAAAVLALGRVAGPVLPALGLAMQVVAGAVVYIGVLMLIAPQLSRAVVASTLGRTIPDPGP